MSCPKCGTPSDRAEARGACPTCGLRVDRWDTFNDRPTPDPVLDPAFSQLDWTSPASHEALVSLAQTAGLLDGAAARYRHALKGTPPGGEEGRAQGASALARISTLVVHAGSRPAPLSHGALRAVRAISFVVALVLSVLVGIVLWRTFGRGFSGR